MGLSSSDSGAGILKGDHSHRRTERYENSQNERRVSYDQVAALYNQIRPGYPNALFEDVIDFSNLSTEGNILEIGCGTGQATLPLARKGYNICCLESGANLAAIAQQNLASYPNAKVLISPFETWGEEETRFNLLISGTAFHWIDPTTRYQKAAQVLKPNGAIALFWNKHVLTERSANFFQAVEAVYKQIAPEIARKFSDLPYPEEVLNPVKEEIDRSLLFREVTMRKYKWNKIYSAADYISLLSTYSDHHVLNDLVREDLFLNITRLINDQFKGQIVKDYLTSLYLAHRK